MYSGVLAAVPPTTATFDFLFNWYLLFGAGAAVIVISMMTFFMIRYRSRGQRGPVPEHKVEGWKVVLITVLISISVLSAAEYQTFASFSNIEPPNGPNAIYIRVNGFQWGWNFTYPDGKFAVTTADQPLTIPVGKTIILNITSKDVFHSFGIIMFAEKEDAIPGKTTQLWFEATQTGFYPYAIRCYELCGVGHATMVGNLSVIDASAWQTQFGVNGTGS